MQQIPLPRTIGWLFSTLKKWNTVPPWESYDAGIHVPSHLHERVNVPYTVPARVLDEDGIVRDKRVTLSLSGSILYYRQQPRTVRIIFDDDKVHAPKSKKRRKTIWNPSGVLITFLRGDIRNGKLPIRHDRLRYSSRLSVAPNWVSTDTVSPFAGEDELRSWDRTVTATYPR